MSKKEPTLDDQIKQAELEKLIAEKQKILEEKKEFELNVLEKEKLLKVPLWRRNITVQTVAGIGFALGFITFILSQIYIPISTAQQEFLKLEANQALLENKIMADSILRLINSLEVKNEMIKATDLKLDSNLSMLERTKLKLTNSYDQLNKLDIQREEIYASFNDLNERQISWEKAVFKTSISVNKIINCYVFRKSNPRDSSYNTINIDSIAINEEGIFVALTEMSPSDIFNEVELSIAPFFFENTDEVDQILSLQSDSVITNTVKLISSEYEWERKNEYFISSEELNPKLKYVYWFNKKASIIISIKTRVEQDKSWENPMLVGSIMNMLYRDPMLGPNKQYPYFSEYHEERAIEYMKANADSINCFKPKSHFFIASVSSQD